MTSTSSGLTMLTTGVSQYIHPDYLQPLPTTLDAKKSPLALLAQTCSAIGKDTSPSKPIIPPLEKKENCDKLQSDKPDADVNKRPRSHGHKDSERDSKSASGFRTFPPKEMPPLVPISTSNEKPLSLSVEPKSTSPCGPVGASIPSSCPPSSRPLSASSHSQPRSISRSSSGKGDVPIDLHHSSSSSYSRARDSPASTSSSHHHREATPPHSKTSSSRSSPAALNSYSSPSTASSSSLSISTSTNSTSSTVKPSPTHPSLLSAGLPAHLAGYPNPLALMSHGLDPSSPSYHSALAAAAAHSSLSSYSAAAAAAQSSALKAAAAAGAGATPALSGHPFVTYARIRTPSGATTLVPVCRDPYCQHCQLTLQNQHLAATCQTPGCAQCAHEKSLTSLSALGFAGSPSAAASSMLLPPYSTASSLSSSMSALSSLHSLYPHSALAAAHQQSLQAAQTPQVCNWYSGGEYCGKRFSTSDELFQHLRTHTSSMDVSSLAASYASSLGLPSALAGYPHLGAPSTLNPASLSPNSLRSRYPTSLSPVSSLLSASRYHPYKSPLSAAGVTAATPPVPPTLPPVGPYYPPYTLYGQRIAGAVVP